MAIPTPPPPAPKSDPRQDSDKPYDPAKPADAAVKPGDPPKPDFKKDAPSLSAKSEDEMPMTAQTDQLKRAGEMEKVGVKNWMEEQEKNIRERQGDPPPQPRQVPGVAPPQKPS
jgi:hypothetical protein